MEAGLGSLSSRSISLLGQWVEHARRATSSSKPLAPATGTKILERKKETPC